MIFFKNLLPISPLKRGKLSIEGNYSTFIPAVDADLRLLLSFDFSPLSLSPFSSHHQFSPIFLYSPTPLFITFIW